MKPPPFEYEDPETVDEALQSLASGEDVLVLAGGQSLIPLLNLRLARPERLIDINRLGELDDIAESGTTLRIGALTRQRALERSPLVTRHAALLAEAVAHVGHAAIRTRGTVGGSLAHADSSAELPVACVALDAVVRVRSAARGARQIPARKLFLTHMTTALEPDELLCEIEVEADSPGAGSAFVEFARRHGDFALGGAAARVALSPSGECTRVDLALLGAAPTPVLASDAAAPLLGSTVDEAATEEAARVAVSPVTDTYRRQVIATMVRRALLLAAARARG